MKSLGQFKNSVQEGVIDTSDFKVSSSGRKVRAHRVKVGDDSGKEEVKESIDEASMSFDRDPPFVLVLRRKAIRMYPNQMKVAIYYNDKINKYFSVPYGAGVEGGAIQAEEVEIEELEESVIDHIHKIAAGEHPTSRVKFASGETRKIDRYTASAISQVHKALNDENKKKVADMVHHSPEKLEKVAAFAFKHAK